MNEETDRSFCRLKMTKIERKLACANYADITGGRYQLKQELVGINLVERKVRKISPLKVAVKV